MSGSAPEAAKRPRVSTKAFTIGAFVIALAVACFLSLLASTSPDGLEFVSAQSGFEDTATDHPLGGAPFADYAIAGFGEEWGILGTIIVGIVGIGAVFLLAWLVSLVAKRRDAD